MGDIESQARVLVRELHDEFSARLQNYALSILRNREDAEDVVQIVFTNAYRSVLAGRVPRSREAWLFQATRNACMNRLRTRRRKGAGTLDGNDRPEVAAAHTTEDALLDRLHVQAFWRAVDALPEPQRQAIILREIRGASYREIAQRMDTTESAVESLIFRARSGIRRTIPRIEARAA